MRKYLIVCSLLITLLTLSFAVKTFNISQEKLNEFTAKYGEEAETRVLIWDKMVENAKSKDILHKLKDVNDFFNKIKNQEKYVKKLDEILRLLVKNFFQIGIVWLVKI